MYYNTLEKIGIPKREVMVHRVEKARDTQEETKEQFRSALEQFTAVTNFSVICRMGRRNPRIQQRHVKTEQRAEAGEHP